MIMTMADGSSPHARGTPTFQFQRHNKARFIPACAGNALAARSPAHRRPVHPRMRGERVRGNHGHANRARFIPACAGNALIEYLSASAHAVHPRMRGERNGIEDEGLRMSGSSPHARGTPISFR